MNKVILINLDLLKKSEYSCIEYLNDLRLGLNGLTNNNENIICFYSRDYKVVNGAKEHYKENYPSMNFEFKNRNEIEKAMDKHKDKAHYYVIIGKKDADFFMAIKHKVLLIVPTWLNMEEKPKKYGVKVDKVDQLTMFINTLNNQNSWYSIINIDNTSTIFSLMDARYGKYAESYQEKDMLMNFESVLKEGQSRNYYEILLYHFLSGMTNNDIFNDIELWGIVPSSDCTLNVDMLSFKEQVRYIKKGYEPTNTLYPNVLKRHRIKDKAHNTDWQTRKNFGASKEFDTLQINPDYMNKINRLKTEGKLNICIFDDYLTHGNSFEAVRNLFTQLGANKIICVSLGTFCTCYQKNDYLIQGNVFSTSYNYTNTKRTQLYKNGESFICNNEAKKEIENLYNIFNN